MAPPAFDAGMSCTGVQRVRPFGGATEQEQQHPRATSRRFRLLARL